MVPSTVCNPFTIRTTNFLPRLTNVPYPYEGRGMDPLGTLPGIVLSGLFEWGPLPCFLVGV